ncbi:MAG: non-homologous end-joining DNA ligase [Dehalococcoidia bacterium]
MPRTRKADPLKEYQSKRNFERTPEPAKGPPKAGGKDLVFVIQKHDATRLHYDVRLEFHEAMVSWAVPKGPSYNPADKRMAVHVEDHPISYNTFEGVIPGGNYGAGEVIVWDAGTHSPDEDGETSWGNRAEADRRMEEGYRRGKISVFFRGQKLKGSWTLVRTGRQGGKDKNKDWLMIKHRDEYADPNREVTLEDWSVQSGLTLADIKAGKVPPPYSPAASAGNGRAGAGREEGPAPGAKRAPFPAPKLRPMLAQTSATPFNKEGWLHEPKLDGIRVLVYVRGGTAQMFSRNLNELTRQYPLLASEIPKRAQGEVVLDGEIVALDENGRPSFQRLQQRMNLSRAADIERMEKEIPVGIVLFDIVHRDGWDLSRVPLNIRRSLLWQAVDQSGRVGISEASDDGIALYNLVAPLGFEGVVAKRKDSLYEFGARSSYWLKIKAFKSAEMVIVGYTEGQGNRYNSLGSLLLGYYDDEGRLTWAGNAGSGFDDRAGDKDLTAMKKRLDAIEVDKAPLDVKPDFSRNRQPWNRGKGKEKIHWVEPRYVAEIKYAEWTEGGNLRAPVFLRLRPDIDPKDVRRGEDRLIVPAAAPESAVGTRLASSSPSHSSALTGSAGSRSNPDIEEVLVQLESTKQSTTLHVAGERIAVSNLDKEFWPATPDHRPYTKRDLIRFYTRISPWILPHMKDRPNTLVRYPNGINGSFFYQKHMEKFPPFVETLRLWSSHAEGDQEYLMVNNLPTLIWLAQIGDIEMHPWLARYTQELDAQHASMTATGSEEQIESSVLNYPDFLLVDLDPYIYKGTEKKGAEPEYNLIAFRKAVEVAFWARELLDAIGLKAFLKTTGKTGLHLFVPIRRDYTYDQIREAAGTIGRYLMQEHEDDITMEWATKKRTGKIFWDHNMNTRGKNLASVYSARPNPEASVSIPVRWEELQDIDPVSYTIESVFARLEQVGDLWEGILEEKQDLTKVIAAADRPGGANAN